MFKQKFLFITALLVFQYLLAQNQKIGTFNKSDIQEKYPVIEKYLENKIDFYQHKEEIKEFYSKLLEKIDDQTIDILVDSYQSVEYRMEAQILNVFQEALFEKEYFVKQKLYNKLKSYILDKENRKWGEWEAAITIASVVDKIQLFNDLTNTFIFYEKKDEGDGLCSLWVLEDLKDKRVVDFLKDYQPKDIREELAIAANYCLVNHNYMENYNRIIGLFEKYKKENQLVGFPTDDMSFIMEKLDDPRSLPFLKQNRRYFLESYGIDSYGFNFDSVIVKIEREKNRLRRYEVKITSSSFLGSDDKENPYLYCPDNVMDGDSITAWVEGVEGEGVNEWIRFEFDSTMTISHIDILAGYFKSRRLFSENNRIAKIEMIFSDSTGMEFLLEDKMGWQTYELNKETDSIKIIIKDVYRGSKYNDTCISEIKIWKGME